MSTLAYEGEGLLPARPTAGLIGRIVKLGARLAAARKARRDFESLRGASDHLLSDIGLTRAQVEHALAAPFWSDPSDGLRRARR